MNNKTLKLEVGFKTDPIQYRYSFDWLFRILSQEDIRFVQLGTFFELYHLPNNFFIDLRKRAENFGLRISSVFTAHRELGGFFYNHPEWEKVARKNYERLIEVASILGAEMVGSNPGAVLRDQIEMKGKLILCYLNHMKELMHIAKEEGIKWLAIEPMSCLAEPPTLPEEILEMGEELKQYHQLNIHNTVPVGYCVDVAHGYADKEKNIRWSNIDLLKVALPYTIALHIKNTDSIFHSTFGFTEAERSKGIVDINQVRQIVFENAAILPISTLIGYVELSGPKIGRDYSDYQLEEQIRETLQYIKSTFSAENQKIVQNSDKCFLEHKILNDKKLPHSIKLAPSLMCADLCHLAESVEKLEKYKPDFLHIDIMDGHFVPNMPIGLDVLKQLKKITSLPMDVHLMVENNDFFIERLAEVGVYQVSIHVESAIHLDRLLQLIRKYGMKAGIAFNPATPLSMMNYVLDRLDFVVLMTVNPGFASQQLVPSAFRKILDCRKYLDEMGLDIPIEVDGNVSFENIPKMIQAGADILVGGTSSIFHQGGSLGENFKKTQQAIEAGLLLRNQSRLGNKKEC